MRLSISALFVSLLFIALVPGCSGSKSSSEKQDAFQPNRDAALSHYLNGGVMDQKEDYASAILEYQDALRFDHDPAIYYAIAKDYAILGKQQLAIQNGKEAVRLSPDNREYHNALAEIYLRAYQFDSALHEYYETIRVDSSYRDGWYAAGRLLSLTKPADALVLYQKYLDYFGDDIDIYNQMVQLYGALGKTDNVLATLKQMALIEPSNFDVKKLLADTYLQMDSTDVALAQYRTLLALQPDNVQLRGSLAYVYLLRKQKTEAQEQIEAVMNRDSVTADEQVQFGQVIASLISKDSTVTPIARDIFGAIREKNPRDWRPYWFLGAIANSQHNDSAAISYFKDVTKLAGWNVDGWIAVASIYYDNEKYDQAVEVLERAKTILPNESRIYFILGISQQRLKNDEDAANSLEQAIQLNNKSVDALSALGLVYDEMSRHEDSDSMYERALHLDPKNALVLNNYSYSLSERGLQLQRALKMSEEALKEQPENQSYLDTKGWIYYQLGRYEEAESTIKRAIDLGSKSPVIHEHLGDVYSRLHNKEKAIEYWQKALDFGGASPNLKDKILRGSL